METDFDKNIEKINIFDDEPRIKAGITRFKNLFFLSPNPIIVKSLIFFSPQIIYTVGWVVAGWLKARLSSFSKVRQ